MKTLLLLLAFICSAAYGGANDAVFTKRNAANTGQNTAVYASPTTVGFVTYDPAILDLTYTTLGSGITVSGGVLNIVGQVNADWSATSGLSVILNKPALFSGSYSDLTGAPVLFSGAYADLTGKPTIPAPQVQSDWSAVSGAAAILNKPSIPNAQVQSDWDASTGMGVVLNKPILSRAIVGTTTKSDTFEVTKNATVAGGVAVFHLTADGTSTGVALFSEFYEDTLSLNVNDATASYQWGWSWSNANKTLTVTVNKLTTANILSGVLGQTPANGAVLHMAIRGK